MTQLRISLFGKFHCEIDSECVSGIGGRKAQVLLSYLALSPVKMHHRDVLCTAIWGDLSEQQARKGLRQALWLLQSALPANGSQHEYIFVDGDWIGLNKHADVWIDTNVLETTYGHFHNVSEVIFGPTEAEQIWSTVLLYKGDLLEGNYYDWCIHERERFQFIYLSLLDRLLSYYELNDDYENGLNCGMQILRHDRARESTHRRLIRLHYIFGHRTRALHQYAACVAALREELGVEPGKSTQQLYAQICDDRRGADAQPLTASITPSPEDPSLALRDPMNDLLHIRRLIELLRQQVDYLIASIQQT